MRNLDMQRGASMPLTITFLAMTAILLTITFKLYPAFYEHWQISSVISSYDKNVDLEPMSIRDIETNFETRLLTNNVRDFNVEEGFFVEKSADGVYLGVDYEVRIPIYSNVDALISFEESFEQKF